MSLTVQYRSLAEVLIYSDHQHPENNREEEGTSFYNQFEVSDQCASIQSRRLTWQVDMAKNLALYFLKQGKYNEEGDIVILVSRSCLTWQLV